MDNKRSFKIVKVDNTSMIVSSGRYISSNPSGAVKKMFSQICRNKKKCNSMIITIKETTQNSNKKEYKYKVKRVKEHNQVVRNGVVIDYEYKIKVKSLNI